MSYIYNIYKTEWSSQEQIDNANLLLTQHRLKLEWNQIVWSVNNLGCGTAAINIRPGLRSGRLLRRKPFSCSCFCSGRSLDRFFLLFLLNLSSQPEIRSFRLSQWRNCSKFRPHENHWNGRARLTTSSSTPPESPSPPAAPSPHTPAPSDATHHSSFRFSKSLARPRSQESNPRTHIHCPPHIS